LNLSTLNLNLNFRDNISHSDDLRYAAVKISDFEKHVLEHEWKMKHLTTYHGYSVLFYVTIGLLCCYVVFRKIRCIKSWKACQRVAAALKLTSRVTAVPESAGSGNVVNINIKTSNESLAITPKEMPLRALKPSDSKTGERQPQPTQPPRYSSSCF
jgi:hypothetical protein